jgi:pimeloyl-ACP methyl ester carboxylesterase
MTPQKLLHGRISLALHTLRSATQPVDSSNDDSRLLPLLMLHGLAGATPTTCPELITSNWNGPIYGLDFTGHGQSTCAVGGGYSAEVLMADVDTALRQIGPAVLLGAGLGGYVALLVSGAAPGRVQSVIVTGGSGLAGGGVRPGSECIAVPVVVPVAGVEAVTPDPFALIELATDIRPPNYVASFVRQFVSVSTLDHPVSICTAARPPWLAGVIEEFGVTTSSVEEALRAYGE